jgi:hypothetical protein
MFARSWVNFGRAVVKFGRPVFEVMDGRVDVLAVLVVDREGNVVVDCWDVCVAVAVVVGVDVVCCVVEVVAAAAAVVLDVVA